MHIDKSAIVLGLAICASAAPWGGPGDQEYCSDNGISASGTISATPSACRWGRREHTHHSQAGASSSARTSGSQPSPMNAAQPTPAPETTTIQSPPPAQSPDPTQAAPTPATSNDAIPPVTTSASSSSVSADMPVAPADGGTPGDYMVTVNQMREAGGLPKLTQDSTLEANAAKTCADSGGQLTHELNPGTMAQVLAGGATNSNFWRTYVGGWLCEIPTLPGLNSVCTTASQGWDYRGETGHATILSSTVYTKIGCAMGSSVWACDLA